MDPINVIQYKYHDAEFGKLISGAFKDFTQDEGKNKITIYTRDKPITLHREPLLIFSPILRSVLNSLSCCAKSAISLPDCSSSAVQYLWRIVNDGVTDFEGQLNMSEIIVAAKCLQIDVTNFEYVKREVVKDVNKKNSAIGQTDLVGTSLESDSDLDENEVDDYGEEDEFENNMETEDDSSKTKVNDEIASFLKLKSQMQDLLDDDDNEDQETLDEKAEDRSFSFNEGSNDSSSSFSKASKSCQICSKKSRNLSFLWQHTCKAHFMKQLKTECEQFIKSKELKCGICEEKFQAKQDLILHVGISHEKLNSVLSNNGHKPLESLKSVAVEHTSIGSSYKEDKSSKFRIPKKSDQINIPEVPLPVQASVPAAQDQYNTGSQSYVARPRLPPQYYQNTPQPQNVQLQSHNWPSALPVSSQPHFRHNTPPLNRLRHPVRLPIQRPQSVQRYPTHQPQYNSLPSALPLTRPQEAQVPSQLMTGVTLSPNERPQQRGLWAQSAKPIQAPIPTSVEAQAVSLPMAMSRQELSMGSVGGFICQICQKTTPTLPTLWQHYARAHFFAELKSDYNAMANITSKSCNECGSEFKAVDALFLHIGTVHRKVNEIMEKRGLVSLEMPGLNRSKKSM